MPARVTNLDLFERSERAANEAADRLTMLGNDYREHRQPPSLESVTRVRNKLREALCAAQELKTRMKRGRQN